MSQFVKIALVTFTDGTTTDSYGDLVQVMTKHEVYARVRSISQNEFYQAQTAGLKPSYKFTLNTSHDYLGEELVFYNGVFYKILRTYINEADEIELTVYGGVRDAHAENSNESS